jgi:hypothetical protein
MLPVKKKENDNVLNIQEISALLNMCHTKYISDLNYLKEAIHILKTFH